LISLVVGNGTLSSGNFSNIDWSDDNYFIKTEIDLTGGINYEVIGVSQLLSTSYTLFAKNGLPNGGQEGNILTMCNGQAIWTIDGNCPQVVGDFPYLYVHCNPLNPTAVVDVINPATGKTWMDRNLGANSSALSSNDAQACGSLFQWGRYADGHQCVNRFFGDGVITSSTTGSTSGSDLVPHTDFITVGGGGYDWRSPRNNSLWQGVNGTNNPCPHGYRLPSEVELNNERLSWSSNNSLGAFNSPLKWSFTGDRSFYDGSTFGGLAYGAYWTSTILGAYSVRLSVESSTSFIGTSPRGTGLAVRCIKH
jgi:hypothetical protein